ncbi:proteinase IV [Halalkalibacillus sediminis]|uniref:Proteinase IV n=1 Tax=Halalkalibacillus sediminis TaxID=2018042 RepID=A0A2I0QRL6_9BACI|nr:serpin family protein [Halalkalibacillus sediminis]PKR76976.1 proteinase IV [Halalkalibacillus sediminis]
MKVKWIALALFCSLLTACGDEGNSIFNSGESFDHKKIDDSLIEGNTDFSWEIFRELSAEDQSQSTFISPFSISTALSMTYQGSEGGTEEEMNEVLGYEGMDKDEVAESYKHYIRYLTQLEDAKINVGNSIWIEKEFSVKDEFIETNRESFDSEVFERTLSKPEVVEEVNEWVDDETEGMIKELLTSPIDPNVKMVLLNAIYFKGDWSEPFDENKTEKREFQVSNDKKNSIPFMEKNTTIHYGEGDNYQAIKMPYGKGSLGMYVILPDESTNLESMIQEMDSSMWNTIVQNLEDTEDVVIQLPKFEVEYGLKNLNKSLQSLGLDQAYNDANFSAMSGNDLRIDRVLHKAVIEVNEKGSEAAAATAVNMTESAPAINAEFIANRPFLYVIADEEHQSILFLGSYYGD